MPMILKGHILLAGSYMELGIKETISQPCIKRDDRRYKFFRELLPEIHKSYKETKTQKYI